MRILNTLVFLPSALAAAHDKSHTNTAQTCKAMAPSITTTPPSTRPIKTVFVTVTCTIFPANSPTVSPSTTPSLAATPSSMPPENKQAEQDGPDSVTGSTPLVTDPSKGETGTPLPIFTLESLSTLTPTTESEDGAEENDVIMSILPAGTPRPVKLLPSFQWPGVSEAELLPSGVVAHDSIDINHVDYDHGNAYADGDTAWASMDSAIPAHMHDRSPRDRLIRKRAVPHLSPKPLQSKSAATRWARRDRKWVEESGSVERHPGSEVSEKRE